MEYISSVSLGGKHDNQNKFTETNKNIFNLLWCIILF